MATFITTLLHKDFTKTYNSNFWNIYCLCPRELLSKTKRRDAILKNDPHFVHEFPPSKQTYWIRLNCSISQKQPVARLSVVKREERAEKVTASKKRDPKGEKTLPFSLFCSSVMNETLVSCVMCASKDYQLSITPKAVNHVRFLLYHRSENYLQRNRKFRVVRALEATAS